MAPGVQAAKATPEKQRQSPRQAHGAKLLLLQSSSKVETWLSDEAVAELAMFILM